MYYDRTDEAAESVQRVWRGFLGRKRTAKIQLDKERERMRAKNQRRSHNGAVKDTHRTSSLAAKTAAADSATQSDDDNVVVYTAVKRQSKLGTFDKKTAQAPARSFVGDADQDAEDTDYPGATGHSRVRAVEEPLLSSHLSVIAEEDEMLRDSLASTAHSSFGKQTKRIAPQADGNAPNSPLIGRKVSVPTEERNSYVADSLEGRLPKPTLRLEKQISGRSGSSRSGGADSNDVDHEAEEIPATARTAGASSEADSVEYGQFVKTDRFEDLIAGLGDDFNVWDYADAAGDKHEVVLQDSLHRSGKFSNMLAHVAAAGAANAAASGQPPPRSRGANAVENRAQKGPDIRLEQDDDDEPVATFVSRKSTSHLKAFSSDGSLSQRVDSYGAPSSDLHSPPRKVAGVADAGGAGRARHLSPEKPFVPSVRDLLAVSPVTPKGTAGFGDVAAHDAGQGIPPRVNMPREPPPSMLSKLEQAQLMYESNVKKNFPALKPSQPTLIVQRPSHSRSNSVSSNAGSLTPPPLSARSSSTQDRSPRGGRGPFQLMAPGLAAQGQDGGSTPRSNGTPRSVLSQPQQPQPAPHQHQQAQQPLFHFPVAPENPQQILKQGYFKQSQQAGSHIPVPVYRAGQALGHLAGGEDQRPSSRQSQGPGTPRSIRIAHQPAPQEDRQPPSHAQHQQAAHEHKAAPPPLRLTPPPQDLAPPAGQRRPQPIHVANKRSDNDSATAGVGGAGGGGGYAAEYANQRNKAQPTGPSLLSKAAAVQPAPLAPQDPTPAPALGRFSNLPSKLIPASLAAPSKAPAALAAVKPTGAKNKAQPLSQTKLTELQEQKLLQEIEQLNQIQLQKMQELAAIEEREKAAAASPKVGAGHVRKASKEIDPIKEKEKRAFKAGAKDVNLAPVLERAKPKAAQAAAGPAAVQDWQEALKRDGVEIVKGAKNRNANLAAAAGGAVRVAQGGQGAGALGRPVSPVPPSIHQNLVSKNPLAAAAAAAVVDGDGQPNVGGYANVGYLQVYKKKQDVKRGGSNLRGHRRNASGEDGQSVNSNNDAQSEGRLFQQRRQQVAAGVLQGPQVGQEPHGQYGGYAAQFEETTSLPAISSSRQARSSGSNKRPAADHQLGGAGQYHYPEPQAPERVPFVHPLDGQNRRVLSASRSNTMSAPSRLHDQGGPDLDEEVVQYAEYRGQSDRTSLPHIAPSGKGPLPVPGAVPVYNAGHRNVQPQARGYGNW